MYLAEIGSRIRRARKARGLTQVTLASRAGIARETLSQFESGTARDLGIAKVLKLLNEVGLELRLLDSHVPSGTDYVAIAASAGSTGFREALERDELVRSLLTGLPPPRKTPHLRRLLEDTPSRIVIGLVEQVSGWAKAGKVQENIVRLARTLGVEVKAEWTNAP